MSDNTTNVEMKKDYKKYIYWMICLLVMIVFLMIPESEFYTPQVRWFLIICMEAILFIAFDLIPILAIGLIGPGCFIAAGVGTPAEALSGWTSASFFMVFGCTVFAYALMECGILQRMSLFIMAKLCKGSVNRLVYLFVLIGLIVSILTVNGSQILMIVFFYGIVKSMGKETGKQTSFVMMCALFGGYCIGRVCYTAVQMAVIKETVEALAPSVGEVTIWTPMIYLWPHIIGILVSIFVLGKIYRVKEMDFGGGMDYLEEQRRALGTISTHEKIGIVYMVVIVLLLVTTSITGLNMSVLFMTLPFIGLLPGLDLVNDKVLKQLPMGTMFFIPFCLTFGTLGTKLGLGDALVNVLTPLFEGKGSVVFVATVFVVGFLANKLLTPLAILSMLTVPMANVAMSLGISPLAAGMALYYAADAYIFPHESALCLLAFAFGVIRFKDFIVMMSIKSVIMFIVLLAIIIPYWLATGLLYL